jgi:HlyD family secretion protein
MKHSRSLLALLLFALAAGVVYWYRQSSSQSLEQRYKLQSIEKGDVTQTVSANGTLNPVVLVSVGTQVSGTVTRLYVDFNDKVEKGQALLELDDSLLAAQARQSAANVQNVAAALDLARASEARMKALFEQEYVSRQELEQAVQTRRSSEAQLAQAKAAAEKDQVNLHYTTIRSPVSGVVVDRVVDLGQTVAASLQTPTLIKIAQDLSEMRIDSSFAEADIGKIREGQKVRFTVDAFPNRSFQGEVQQIRLNPTTQQNVVTYNVRVSLSNPEQILLPGMTAYVSIGVASRQNVLLVPNAALRFKPSESSDSERTPPDRKRRARAAAKARARAGKRDTASGTAYRVENGELKALSVSLGITDNRNTEVLGGDLKVWRHRRHRRECRQQQRQAEQRRDETVLMAEAVIRVVGLGKSYETAAGRFPALQNVDLCIEAGEFVAIMGPSGSGKSTFMNLLGCLDTPSSGDYFLVGRNVAQLRKDELAATPEPQHRLRLPGFQPAAADDADRQCRPAAGLCRHRARAAAAASAPRTDQGRPRRLRRRAAEPHLGWTTAARGDCARADQLAATDPCRRTDRQPRQPYQRRDHGAVHGPQP